MAELVPVAEIERRTGIPRGNETPTEYVRRVLRESDVDEETAEAVVEAYQYGLFAADPTFDDERAAALDRFAEALPDDSAAGTGDDSTAGTGDDSTAETEAQSADETASPGEPEAAETRVERRVAETSGEADIPGEAETSGEAETVGGGDTAETEEAAGRGVLSSLAGWRPSAPNSTPSVSTPDLGVPTPDLDISTSDRDVSTARVGTWLVVLSVVALVASVVVGAALAPPVSPTGGAAGGAGDAPENGTLVGLHVGGRVVEYGPQGDQVKTTNKLSNGGSYFGVSELANGSVLAGFMKGGYEQCGPYEAKCFRTGARIVDFGNGSTDVQYEWTYPIRTAHSSEVHDVELLPSGDLLVAGMEYERVFVVDRETGNVSWQWNASSYYDAPADPTKEDWLHINDVDRVGEERYMVSVRNKHQILFVERGEGVVDVVNEEGDTSLIEAQHNPQYLGPGALLVADSENDRVVEIHEVDGEWQVVWELKSAGGLELDWPRDADRLPNGNTLVTDTYNERVVEVNRSGEVVWSTKTGRVPYEADRLPGGEYPAGDPYEFESGRQSVGESTGELPVFGYLLASMRHVAPVPYWVADWHLVVLTFSLLGTLVGGVLRWRGE